MENIELKKKLYLDTCVISGLAKGDMMAAESAAALAIIKVYKAGKIELVSSVIAGMELEKIPEAHRVPHQSVFLLIDSIPKAHEYRIDSGLMLMGVGGGRRPFPLFQQLAQALPDAEDAKHLFTAIRNGCTHFITVDSKTILKNRNKVAAVNSIILCSPAEYFELEKLDRT